jgi:orotate phosphoribosyltransferase
MSSSPRAADRARLVAIVREKSFSTGGAMTLASGRTSTFYFNMKPTMLDPEGSALIASLMLDVLRAEGAEFVGGLELGAVPLVACIAQASHLSGHPIPAFFVRKQVKDHGTRQRVEGLAPGVTLQGRNAVVLEDVTTTGGSALEAAEAVRAAGGTVRAVLTVVDRREGAETNLSHHGLILRSLLTAADFGAGGDSQAA